MGPLAIFISGFSRQGQALDRQRHLRLLGFITQDLFIVFSELSCVIDGVLGHLHRVEYCQSAREARDTAYGSHILTFDI